MLRGRKIRIVVTVIVGASLLLATGSSALAADPHEDPEAAKLAVGGISLFGYYSSGLDSILIKNTGEVKTRLEKMLFANIPERPETSTDDFVASSVGLSHLVVAIDENLSEFGSLMAQSRLDEAVELADLTFVDLGKANRELERVRQAAITAGRELEVFSIEPGSELRRSYDELAETIASIGDMLALYQELLESTGLNLNLEQLLKSAGIDAEKLPDSTAITMEIEPVVAFVGDTIRAEGELSSRGRPLAQREVDILLNSSEYATIETDRYGHYEGVIQVPFRYVPSMDVPSMELKALYYPRETDRGVYLASLSPVTKLDVLFYEAELELGVDDEAFPGLETRLTGMFDYGQSPPPSERKAEIYLDDILITRVSLGEEFTRGIGIGPETRTGEHVITVSAVETGRYSRVVSNAILNVTKLTPILDLNLPNLVLIPGKVRLEGRIESSLGPFREALIKVYLGGSEAEFLSSEDGSFDSEVGVGMGFGLAGLQDLTVRVLPREPWYDTLSITSSLLVVNWVNSGLFAAILLFLGIYLPERLKRRLGVSTRRRPRVGTPALHPESAPVYTEGRIAITAAGGNKISGGPRDGIFYWYRRAVNLLGRITSALLGPQQTLREFARENGRVLGAAARYFTELTAMVERQLYSKHSPTEADVETSRQLSIKMEEETKQAAVTVSPDPGTEEESKYEGF
ncbi:MAG: DUF4129 domain-containing protein [Dehalococcoidales bacterium]|nr:DUF4129 domain-containing protein [Dehalococcoidales bacterium]